MTPVLASLTSRQEAVLDLLAEGLTNKEIASRLGISTRTARAHIEAIFERLGADTRTQAVAIYLRSLAA